MRKRTRPWYRLRLIVLALLVVPPLGLVMLWKSPRTLRAKIIVSVAFVLFVSIAFGVAVKTRLYERFQAPEIPIGGYDVTRDSRGRYHNPRILPFELEVFSAVVKEMRRLQPAHTVPDEEITSIYMVQPEAEAFEIVAEKKGLDSQEVKAIYLKVSTLLARSR